MYTLSRLYCRRSFVNEYTVKVRRKPVESFTLLKHKSTVFFRTNPLPNLADYSDRKGNVRGYCE